MVSVAQANMLSPIVVEQDILINAPPECAFEALLEELGPSSQSHTGMPMPMVLEAKPGGRWFRDLGNDSGHLWGFVQVIKPPYLLEISGPLFMSYPSINHVQYRLTAEGTGTRLKLVHRGYGEIPQEHRDGVFEGWSHYLNRTKRNAESQKK